MCPIFIITGIRFQLLSTLTAISTNTVPCIRVIYFSTSSCIVNYRLWWTGEAVLETGPGTGFVGVPLDEVSHGVLWTPAVHDLLRRVVRVGDVGPRHVLEVLALLQLANRLTGLQLNRRYNYRETSRRPCGHPKFRYYWRSFYYFTDSVLISASPHRWIYFHRERDLFENSYHLMPRLGFKLRSVELAPL